MSNEVSVDIASAKKESSGPSFDFENDSVTEELEVAENSTTLSSANTPEKANSKFC